MEQIQQNGAGSTAVTSSKLEQVLSLAEKAIQEKNLNLTKEALILFRELGVGKTSDGETGDAFRSLWYFRLPQLTDRDALKIIGSELIQATKAIGYNFETQLQNRIESYETPELAIDFMTEALRLIISSEETLSSDILLSSGASAPGYIKNWIKDFEYVAGLYGGKTLGIIDYVNNSQNAKKLEASERISLMVVLGIYTALKNTLNDWEKRQPVYVEDVPNLNWEILSVSEDEVDNKHELELLKAKFASGLSTEIGRSKPVERGPEQKVDGKLYKEEKSGLDGNVVLNNSHASVKNIGSEKVGSARFTLPDLHEKELPEPPSDMFLEPAHDAQGSQVSANNLPSTSAQIKKEKVAETKQVLQEKDLNSDDQKPVLPPGVKMPSLAKPLERKTKLPPLKLPKTLGDLSSLKQSAQNKKQQVQSDIDQRLNNLNEELDN